MDYNEIHVTTRRLSFISLLWEFCECGVSAFTTYIKNAASRQGHQL
jgi:hypothetical protein